MGFRYRKSKNLGGGFRVNMSKSGPGFSWGTKGLRITRTANGRIRGTAYIPGTGLSYQKDFGNPSKKRAAARANDRGSKAKEPVEANSFNNDLASINSTEMADINQALNKGKRNSIIGFLLILLGLALFFVNKYLIILAVFGLGFLIYDRKNDGVRIDYDLTAEAEEELAATNKLLAGIMESDGLWLVTATEPADPDTGADMIIRSRTPLNFREGNDEIETNTPSYTLEGGGSKLIFLPDSVFIKQNGKLAGLSFKEIDLNLGKLTFLEEERVPADASILGKAYLHTTKDGSPDKRYKDNPELTLVEYGTLSLYKEPGLDTLIVFSDTVLDGK